MDTRDREHDVIVPADPLETAQAVRAIAAFDGPVFLRVSRLPVPMVHRPDYTFEIGRACQLRPGSDLTIVAAGITVASAVAAATLLEADGISAAVLNMSTIRPIDDEAIITAARRGPILTVEEHTTVGGLGSAVAEVVVGPTRCACTCSECPASLRRPARAEFLLDHFGLTPNGIRRAARTLVRGE